MRNLHHRFDWHYIGQIYSGDFAKFCGLLRTYELYITGIFQNSLIELLWLKIIQRKHENTQISGFSDQTNIHCGPLMMSKGKAPWKDPEGSLQLLRGISKALNLERSQKCCRLLGICSSYFRGRRKLFSLIRKFFYFDISKGRILFYFAFFCLIS